MFSVRCLRGFTCAAALLTLFTGRVQAQLSLSDNITARSVSGLFVVGGSQQTSSLANSTAVANNPEHIRLEPALLAVSAERIKQSLWRQLGIKPDMARRARIFLTLHPAQSLADDVTIVSGPSGGGWSYQVQLPDVLTRSRFTRALVSTLLLEFANRNAQSHSAEIPAWLADGLSQQLHAESFSEMILSSPDKILNGLEQSRTVATQRGLDPLAHARDVLQNHPALTFEQLSWPTRAQLSGDDGGVYRASAQLFVDQLLDLNDGASRLRAMLLQLPQFYNWQTAFLKAFHDDFSETLDVEKWWALQVVNFTARDPGPQWTPAVSRDKLDQILSVPVEVRSASNALPAHAEVSLQAVIRNYDSARQTTVLQTKLRDLQLAQLRMAPALADLTDGYRRALAAYLGEDDHSASTRFWQKGSGSQKTGAPETLKKLDALDARRRTIEAGIKPDALTP